MTAPALYHDATHSVIITIEKNRNYTIILMKLMTGISLGYREKKKKPESNVTYPALLEVRKEKTNPLCRPISTFLHI